jgi:hypothetical protein
MCAFNLPENEVKIAVYELKALKKYNIFSHTSYTPIIPLSLRSNEARKRNSFTTQ